MNFDVLNELIADSHLNSIRLYCNDRKNLKRFRDNEKKTEIYTPPTP